MEELKEGGAQSKELEGRVKTLLLKNRGLEEEVEAIKGEAEKNKVALAQGKEGAEGLKAELVVAKAAKTMAEEDNRSLATQIEELDNKLSQAESLNTPENQKLLEDFKGEQEFKSMTGSILSKDFYMKAMKGNLESLQAATLVGP